MTEFGDYGPLFEAEQAGQLQRDDRANPIPNAEPPCPVCNCKIVRLVEAHPAPRSDSSPFRVRLVCTNEDCRRWTVYNW